MAKAKSKTRGAAPGAPKPKIEPKRPPLTRRPAFRRTALVVFVLFSVWLGTFTWGNVSRAHALRVYGEKLQAAQGNLVKHLQTGGPTNIDAAHQGFVEGSVTVKRLRELAAIWEKDFTAARDAIRALDPDSGGDIPDEVVDANGLIAEGAEMFRGVARLYVVAAGQRTAVATEKDDAQEKTLDEQLQLLLVHIKEWRDRAGDTHSLGVRRLLALGDSWGVADLARLDLPTAGGPIPDGFQPPGDLSGLIPGAGG